MEQFLGVDKLFDYTLYLRGLVITCFAIIFFRINLSRMYGNHSALDFIIYIILGAVLGEAIVNNIPLIPSMVVATLIMLIYRLLVYITYKSAWMGSYIKGDKVVIIKNGSYIQKNLSTCLITSNDILQALRLQHGLKEIDTVEEAILERGGQISFMLKNRDNKI